MSKTFFIGDTHFGHGNILKFEAQNRPFSNLSDMHEAMVERWNSVVNPDDLVWHLGDVVFGAQNLWIVNRLNGRKNLVMGNHDHFHADVYKKYFQKIVGCATISPTKDHRWILTHIPVHPYQLESRFTHNIHGHMHSKALEDNRYINVSCERNYLTPMLLEDIICY